MKKNFPTLIFLLFFALVLSEAMAEDQFYDCTINHVYDINDIGEIKESGWQGTFIGGKFQVSRQSGKIVGETLTTMLAKQTRVINSGTEGNSFKAMAEFDGQVQLIEIKVYKEGEKKPFIASSMGGAGIVTGVCECK